MKSHLDEILETETELLVKQLSEFIYNLIHFEDHVETCAGCQIEIEGGLRGKMSSLIGTSLISLLEKYGEEVIGNEKHYCDSCKRFGGYCMKCRDIAISNKIRTEQRLKVKEIITNLK